MKISAVLEQAWELISQPGQHCQRSFALTPDNEVVHALHPQATRWDSTGALQKVIGEVEGPTFTAALGCLGIGAIKSSTGRSGIVEINDNGSPAELRRMWLVAIASAKEAEAMFSVAAAAA